jgi:hypothetical protein
MAKMPRRPMALYQEAFLLRCPEDLSLKSALTPNFDKKCSDPEFRDWKKKTWTG